MNEKLKVFDNKKKLVIIQSRLDAPKIFQDSLLTNATITSTTRRHGSFMNLMTPRGSTSLTPITPIRNSTNLTPKTSPNNSDKSIRKKSFRESISIPKFFMQETPRGGGTRRGSLLNFGRKIEEEIEIEEEKSIEEEKFNIIEPHRTFVFEGVLKVFTKEEELCIELTESQKKKAKRNTLLFSDMILFCIEGPTAGSLIYKSKQMLNLPYSIPWCREINNEIFQLITQDITYTCIANSNKDRNIWMTKISEVIESIITKGTLNYDKIGKAEPLYTPLISLLSTNPDEEIEEKRKSINTRPIIRVHHRTGQNQQTNLKTSNPITQNSIDAFQKIKNESLTKIEMKIEKEESPSITISETSTSLESQLSTKDNIELKDSQGSLKNENELEITISVPTIEIIQKPDEIITKKDDEDEVEKDGEEKTTTSEKETNLNDNSVSIVVNNEKDESVVDQKSSDKIDITPKENEILKRDDKKTFEKPKLELDLAKVKEQQIPTTIKKTARARNFSLFATKTITSARGDNNVKQEEKKEESGCIIS